jgi:Fe-S cluster assembly protein SufD
MAQTQSHTSNALQKLAMQLLLCKDHPSSKQEEWRYSDLNILERDNNKIDIAACNPNIQLDEAHYYIVIVNGILDKQRLSLPKQGITLCDIADQNFLQVNLHNGFDNKYQVLESYSRMSCGIALDIKHTLDKPLKIYYLGNAKHNCVLFVKLRKSIDIKLYEEFIGNTKNIINQTTKLELDKNAKCKHLKYHNFTECVRFLYSSKVICEASAQYHSYSLNIGCNSYRQDVECELQGENAACNFYGINIGNAQQKYDVILNVSHQKSNTSSIQHYNQILADRSRGSFYTKVIIPKFLHSIKAHQLNKNLLLDETTQAFSRPEFDIHSDDVICSHGSTVGSIDLDAMNYLKSRGINHTEAKKLILQGFARSVFEDKGLDKKDYELLVDKLMKYIK